MAFTAILREYHETQAGRASGGRGGDARFGSSALRVHHVVVHAFSPERAMIECHYPMADGQRLAIQIPDVGQMTGEIVCHDGIYYDCAFDVAINPERVREKLIGGKVLRFPTPPQPVTRGRPQRTGPLDPRRAAARHVLRGMILVMLAVLCWLPFAAYVFGWIG